MTAPEALTEAQQDAIFDSIDEFEQYDLASAGAERVTVEGAVRNAQDLAQLMLRLRLAYGWARRGDLVFSVETTT
jgi:hypothetical protein